MFVSFDHLPDSARIWIYQAGRPFSEAEVIGLQPALARFAEAWTSHGRTLQASATILHRQFLVIGLNEAVADASGCSIDASVRFVREVEQQLGVELLEKSRLAFLINGEVKQLGRLELKQAVAEGILTPETLYFDNTVARRGQLQQAWPAPAATTWLTKYFPAAAKI
jgi:hypothetical protein